MRLPLSLSGAARQVRAGAALPARLASLRPLAASNLALGGSFQPGLASNPARFGPEVRKYARLGEAEGLAHVGTRLAATHGHV